MKGEILRDEEGELRARREMVDDLTAQPQRCTRWQPMVEHHDDVVEAPLQLPVVGEAPAGLADLVEGGQAVILTRAGVPAFVVVDVDTWREVEQLTEAAS